MMTTDEDLYYIVNNYPVNERGFDTPEYKITMGMPSLYHEIRLIRGPVYYQFKKPKRDEKDE
jgi:hypothetical protein